MNGWLRLWVLVSIMWAVLVVSVAAIVIPEKLQAVDPTTAGPIESGSKYGDNPFDQFDEERPNPSAQFDITLPNGTIIKGVPEGTSEEEIKYKAIRSGWATAADFQQDESAASLMLSVPTLEQQLTLEEMATYTSESRAEKNKHERQEVIWGSILASAIPPLMLLALGYGVAWVLRGFGAGR